MTVPAHEILEAARIQAGMSFTDLWLAYFALGGVASLAVMRSYLDGSGTQSIEYDVMAHALNESFVDQVGDHPVPYGDDLA